jgi:GntP family gluconate:H+ symporter
MVHSFPYLLGCLGAAILLIVVLTVRLRVPAFFALVSASFFVGLAMQMPVGEIVAAIQQGFGNILKSLGLIIVLGTTLGVILERNGSIAVMSSFILRIMGERHIALAMNITGFIVGLPVFCDSGFIVLSGLNRSLARRAGVSILVTSVSLASGLYAVHCLIPPHPGAAAAAGTMGVDFGRLLLAGIVIAIPAALAGYAWAVYAGKKWGVESSEDGAPKVPASNPPSEWQAFMPILLPVFLMAGKSLLTWEKPVTGSWSALPASLGEPVIALSFGVFLALITWKDRKGKVISALLAEGAEKAGGILVIIGAGGAFGAVLNGMQLGQHFSQTLPLGRLGILFPFLITSLLKTAQGSSTVAIITAASLIEPLLPSLGLGSANGRLLCILSMGAGSMMISHANDAYFWVIAKFSGLKIKPMFKVYSVATLWMGLVGFGLVCILSLLLPH